MFTDAIGQQHARATSGARIVSLVPSITELLFALGLGEQVVGRTGFCVHPRDRVRGVPKLGGTKDIEFERLIALHPTHVIVNVDENERPDYERLRETVPQVIVTHPNAPPDNVALFRLLGSIFDRDAEATTLVTAFERGLERLQARDWPPRRVLYLIWRDPWMSVSPDTYIARTLALVGWQVVTAATGDRYPTLDDAQLASCGAELVLLSSEPYPFRDKHRQEIRRLCPQAREVLLVDGEMLSWYGNRAIAGLDYLENLALRERRDVA